jgi:hypothetical protein
MVTDCPVGLAENVIAEGSRAKTECAANVEAAKPALPGWTAMISLAQGVSKVFAHNVQAIFCNQYQFAESVSDTQQCKVTARSRSGRRFTLEQYIS